MRLIAVEGLQPGMKLARAIFREDDGGILLRPNIDLKPSYIDRLKALKYHSVYILNSQVPQEELVQEAVNEETRFKARGLLKKAAVQLLKDEKVSTQSLKNVVTELVDQIAHNIDNIYNLVDIRSDDNYFFAHSVNVCIIALMIGMEMGFNRKEMENLGVGALLHDIGKIFIDAGFSEQFGYLEPREFEQIKKHARLGYDTLRQKFEVNFLAAHIAFQHHEREDGSGYPRGLTGKRIHRFAKIVAVADSYDVLTSRRVRGISSHRAIQEIKAEADAKFERSVIQCFTTVVAPYLVGTVLQLNNGDTVLVTSVSRNECRVMVLYGCKVGTTFNLYNNVNLSVDKVAQAEGEEYKA
jgi:putative nucleotidyltransferase with HDIG domain